MSETETPPGPGARRHDDAVGTSGSEPAGGGRQTAEQAAVTRIEPGGRDDSDRNRETGAAADRAGRPPVAIGGSSGGHSDRKPAGGAEDESER